MQRLLCLLLSSLTTFAAIEVGSALPQAHAHNDYEHSRPLLDALSHGFTSIEADIFLVDGKLLVAHDRKDLDPAKTLSKLYLDPLKSLLHEKHDRHDQHSIFPTGESLTLLIDFKTEAQPTYEALRNLLNNYRAMLTTFEAGSIKTNAVTIIISGNRPREILLSEKSRLAAFDGRLADLGKELPVSFMPLVSDNWNSHFTWKGTGAFPKDQRSTLHSIVTQAHSENRKIRFWASPDTESAWKELRAAGADLINTDNLPGLANFLRKD